MGFEIGRRVGIRGTAAAVPHGGTDERNRKQQEEKAERKRRILALLAERGEVQNDEVQRALGVSDASATNYLDELEKEGRVAQSSSTGRGVSYRKIAI